MLYRRTSFMLCGLLLTTGLAAFAAEIDAKGKDWPQWRGPHRDAISTDTGLLKEWEPAGPPLAWKVSGLGKGFSSLAITGGRIYTTSDIDKKEYVLALNEADGKEIWRTPMGPSWDGSYPGARCTPTVDGARLYAVSPLGDLVCLETETGKEVWRKSFVKDFGGKPPHWGFGESLLIDGEKLVCTPCGPLATLVALNKNTGKVIWKCTLPKNGNETGAGSGSGYSSIVISEAGGIRQYVQMLGAGRGCIGVNAKTGKFLWGFPRVGNGTATIPTPIVKGDYVFCSSGYGTGAALLKLEAKGTSVKADEVYFLEGKTFQNHHGGMVLLGDYIYAGNGNNNGFPTCLELKTGNIVWGGKERGPGTGSAAPVYADGGLYFRYQDGTMALIGATPDAYKVHGSFKIPEVTEPSWSHPVVVGGKLYLREQDNLFVYQLTAK